MDSHLGPPILEATALTTVPQPQPKIFSLWVATIAQWIHLQLPSCRPGSNPKHTIYAFINLNLNLSCDMLKRRK